MVWDVTFTCLLNDRKLEAMITFMDLLYSTRINKEVEDQVC